MKFYGALREIERVGDFLIRIPILEQSHDFLFALGEMKQLFGHGDQAFSGVQIDLVSDDQLDQVPEFDANDDIFALDGPANQLMFLFLFHGVGTTAVA